MQIQPVATKNVPRQKTRNANHVQDSCDTSSTIQQKSSIQTQAKKHKPVASLTTAFVCILKRVPAILSLSGKKNEANWFKDRRPGDCLASFGTLANTATKSTLGVLVWGANMLSLPAFYQANRLAFSIQRGTCCSNGFAGTSFKLEKVLLKQISETSCAALIRFGISPDIAGPQNF